MATDDEKARQEKAFRLLQGNLGRQDGIEKVNGSITARCPTLEATMAFDTLSDRMGGRDNVTPMRIAHHTLFTAREKLDLLHQLKSDVTVAEQEGTPLGFAAEEIDEAIEEVRRGVQDGVGGATVARGDF